MVYAIVYTYSMNNISVVRFTLHDNISECNTITCSIVILYFSSRLHLNTYTNNMVVVYMVGYIVRSGT